MIREATVDDKFRLVEMSTRFILSTNYHQWLEVVPERISKHVDTLLEHGAIFVAERVTFPPAAAMAYLEKMDESQARHELVGMLAVVGPVELIDGRLYVEEVAWWVEPEHRGGTVAKRLMHHMEGWCVQNSVYMVKMVAPNDSVGLFYERCGYKAVETSWVKVFS